MRNLRRKALSVFIGLTAISTLIAATPHFSCRCPNGRVKPFCFSSPSGASQCCCGGSCCSSSGRACCCSSPSAENSDSCCRADNAADGAAASLGGVQFRGNRCTKTLVAPALLALPESKSAASDDGASWVLLPSPYAICSALSHIGSVRAFWQIFRVPPPTDLVVALQRFTI